MFTNSGYSYELGFIADDVENHLNPGKHFYVAKCQENQTYHTNYQYGPESGDTISPDDIVRIQYLSLPYPPVSKERLMRERSHYDSLRRHIPYEIPPQLALEAINHYLYQGANEFR